MSEYINVNKIKDDISKWTPDNKDTEKIKNFEIDKHGVYIEYYSDDGKYYTVDMTMTFNMDNTNDRRRVEEALQKGKSPLLKELNRRYYRNRNIFKNKED